jgi:hypothetical protein
MTPTAFTARLAAAAALSLTFAGLAGADLKARWKEVDKDQNDKVDQTELSALESGGTSKNPVTPSGGGASKTPVIRYDGGMR